METNNLVTSEDAVTVKTEPYFICLEDNWITMESEVLVADAPIHASTTKNELHHDTLPPPTSGEHIEPDIPVDPETHIPGNELIIKDEPSTDGEYFEPDLPSIKNELLESNSPPTYLQPLIIIYGGSISLTQQASGAWGLQ